MTIRFINKKICDILLREPRFHALHLTTPLLIHSQASLAYIFLHQCSMYNRVFEDKIVKAKILPRHIILYYTFLNLYYMSIPLDLLT